LNSELGLEEGKHGIAISLLSLIGTGDPVSLLSCLADVGEDDGTSVVVDPAFMG